ncbi:hypothetical protein FUAX_05720 [Fulvitalea axinellae]|uniref:Uncharacterized protein n=1 Tax=Fulvitalea axinellae TaxID=1182444 RepID=A0AAU9DBI3_9BACT|nr:hypothetical protein FUAX_05720 [Fulvitalea axinellae]
MRYYLTTIFNLIIFLQANAECGSSGISVYPSKGEINKNGIIVIEGYSMSQPIIDSLNTKYPVYLESEGHKVRLRVLETLYGMYSLTQAVLKPEQELQVGKTYRLVIENRREIWLSGPLTRWNSETRKSEPIAWGVKNHVDKKPPVWRTLPRLVGKSVEYYGCGPEANAIFSLDIIGEGTLIRTEFVNLKTKKVRTYLLKKEHDGQLYVGHGMCSGAFSYTKEGKYKVRFRLMDMSGNMSENWTAWTTYDSPYRDSGD